MSRTDKTKPWRVRRAEHDPVAEHDHSDGICDMPESRLDNKWRGCHWSDFNLIHGGCCWGCGCPRCNDTVGRRAKRKRERLKARQANLREIAWGDERYGISPVRPAPTRKKNTARWCKGKEGREHVEEVRWAHAYAFILSLHLRRTCYEAGPGDWRKGWHCYHEVGCSVCGKILKTTCPKAQCPTWLGQQQ